MEHPVTSYEGRVRLRRHERRARHRLDTARDEEITVAGDDGMAGADDGCEARGAEPVDGDAADGIGQARKERSEARDVAVVLARLVGAAEPDVLDLLRGHARASDRLGNGNRREIVGPHRRQPTAVAADRRAYRREDHGSGHRAAARLRGRSAR